MTLIDPSDPTQQHLIDVVARGFREAGNQWPIFQYVEAQLDEWFTSEATDVLRSCPRLTFGTSVGSYGWFRVTGQHPYEPAPEDQVTLSVAGIARSTEMSARADQFVQLVNYLADRLRVFTPDPVTVVPLVVTSEEILEHFDTLTYPRKSSALADVSFLAEVLEHEPPVLRGLLLVQLTDVPKPHNELFPISGAFCGAKDSAAYNKLHNLNRATDLCDLVL